MPPKVGEYVNILKNGYHLRWKHVKGEPKGVAEVPLHVHKDGSYTHLLRVRKGTELPVSKHTYYEEAYYIKGRMLNKKMKKTIIEGDYIFHEPGEEHGPFKCLGDCSILEVRYYK